MQEQKQLRMKLRFPEFNCDYQEVKLKRITEVYDGTHQTPKYVKSGVPFYSVEHVSANQFEKTKYISEEVFEKENKRVQLEKGDILMTRIGSIGVAKHIDWNVRASFYVSLALIKNPKEHSSLFLNQYIASTSFQKELWKRTIHVAFPRKINLGEIGECLVRLPNISEQLKIADFLKAIDNRIEVLEKKKKLLKYFKEGVIQKIFKQELKFKDDKGNDFPKWSFKQLGGLTIKVGKKNKENIQYPIYSINNKEGFRPQSEQFEGLDSNDRGYDISLYKIVRKETFAYNPARINVGSIGYSYDLKEVIVSSLYVCFKTNKELEDLFLLAYLDTNKFNKDILRYEEGGVRKYLFYDNFSQIKIPLPSNEEQIKIANFLSAIDKNIAIVNTKIERTKTYKKGLLQHMFM